MVVSPATVSIWCMVLGCGPPISALLNAPVLKAEGNLQVEDLFAVALEAEMPRFDDAGVNRTDRHLVNLFALNLKIVHDPGQQSVAVQIAPRNRCRSPNGLLEPDRLQPGMASAASVQHCSAISRSNRCTCGQTPGKGGERIRHGWFAQRRSPHRPWR